MGFYALGRQTRTVPSHSGTAVTTRERVQFADITLQIVRAGPSGRSMFVNPKPNIPFTAPESNLSSEGGGSRPAAAQRNGEKTVVGPLVFGRRIQV